MVAIESESHNWELYKENAAPLERGRNVTALTSALAPSSSNSLQRQEQDANIQNFERLVKPSEKFLKLFKDEEKAQSDSMGPMDEDKIQELLVKCKVNQDPLVHWLRYIKYHEETYPSDTNNQFLLMERCTQTMIHHPKYTNDTRFIRVCVLYADKTSDPHEQFKFFHKHKIGSQTAIFWLAWAWVAEKKNDFPFAEKIFRKAIQKKAHPIDKVNERYKQFQRRMSRHWLNANAAKASSVYDGEDEEESSNKRSVLVGLTEEGVRQNHRGIGVNTAASRQFGIQTNSLGNNSNQPSNNDAQPIGGFRIFADEGQEHVEGYDLNRSGEHDDENTPIPQLVRQQERSKENIQKSEAWNERGGLYGNRYSDDDIAQGASSVVQRWAGNGGDSIVAGGTSSRPAFAVFVDEDCNSNKSEDAKQHKQSKTSERGGLRQRLDESSSRQPLPRSLGTSKSNLNGKAALSEKPPKDKDEKQSIKTGFNKKLISKDVNGDECCFEEHRMRNGSFRRMTGAYNFNLLHQVNQDPSSMSMSMDSCMDIDDASDVDEVEMEDDSIPKCPTSKIEENEDDKSKGNSIIPRQPSRKVLFGTNNSIIANQSYADNSRMNNTSTASSTLDERDAVGVFGDKEETVNTKFAALELSRMFSSPVNQSNLCTSRVISDKPLFSANEIESPKKETFSIFHDEIAEGSHSPQGGVLAIFEDNSKSKRVSGKQTSSLPIYEDESSSDDDSYNGEERGGDTASFADLLSIMKDASPRNFKTKNSEISIFCDDESNADVLDLNENIASTAAFGDISFIPREGETVDLQEKMGKLSLAKKRKGLNK